MIKILSGFGWLRNSFVASVMIAAAFMVSSATSASAVVYYFTDDHCSGGCGTPPFGSVTLIQNGTQVDVTVSLNAGYSYVQTGAGNFQVFKFNATDVVVGDISIDDHSPQTLVASTGTYDGNGTGFFGFGIACPLCGTGGSNAFTGNIVFHIADAVIADLTVANDKGFLFASDVLAPNGNTGPVAVVPGPTMGGGIAGLIMGFGALLAWRRRQKGAAATIAA